ncbi:MAG: hypothetical protein ACPL7M_05025 [Bryobacteraceae bacterium]
MPIVTALLLAAVLIPGAEAAPKAPEPASLEMTADSAKEKAGDSVLSRYAQASGSRVARGITMAALFAASLPKMGKAATVSARRLITRDGAVNYEITDRRGDATVWKELILRYINGEMENAGRDHSNVAVTPANYKFKYKGERERDGRIAHVFEVTPRKKRQGLFKGEIWIDSETALTVYETGRFVKSPSVFLKKVEFSREYAILDGVAIPKTMQTSIETRFWGPAQLDIQFSDFHWEDPLFALN